MSYGILHWPSPQFDSFEQAVQEACNSGDTLVLREDSSVVISDTLTIKSSNCDLRICGDLNGNVRPHIQGMGHCVLKLMGKRIKVTLENLTIQHSAHASQKSEIGGAIFCLNTSKISMRNCEITSDYGFGVWTVQRAKCYLYECTVSSVSRSGCVSFGHSTLIINSSMINNCGQHGVCLRGACTLRAHDSTFRNCSVRALYAYDSAHVCLQRCLIEGTDCPDHAAVELNGPQSPEDRSRHLSQRPSHTGRGTSFGLSRRVVDGGGGCRCLTVDDAEHQRCAKVHMVIADTLFRNNKGKDVLCIGDHNVIFDCSGCFRYCDALGQCVALQNTAVTESWTHIDLGLLSSRSAHVVYKCSPNSFEFPYDECLDVKTSCVSKQQAGSRWFWSYQRNDEEWVRYPSEISTFLHDCFGRWTEQQRQQSEGHSQHMSGVDSTFQQLNEEDCGRAVELPQRPPSGPGEEAQSEISRQQQVAEEEAILLPSVRLPPPFENYAVDFSKLQQINLQTYFIRAIGLFQQ
jgi:hypothetical protein